MFGNSRNCVVGRGLLVKISHFATDTDQYSQDYYKLDGKMPLPIRWMVNIHIYNFVHVQYK